MKALAQMERSLVREMQACNTAGCTALNDGTADEGTSGGESEEPSIHLKGSAQHQSDHIKFPDGGEKGPPLFEVQGQGSSGSEFLQSGEPPSRDKSQVQTDAGHLSAAPIKSTFKCAKALTKVAAFDIGAFRCG